MTHPTITNLHPNEYTQRLCYYPFMVNLDRSSKVVILSMIYLIEYVFQTKQKI